MMLLTRFTKNVVRRLARLWEIIFKKICDKTLQWKSSPKVEHKQNFLSVSCFTVFNWIVWRKEIDFKLQTSTPFFEVEMPKTFVNMFIHFAICQTEKSGLGTQAELPTPVGKKGWEVQIETQGAIYPSPVISFSSTSVVGITKEQNLIAYLNIIIEWQYLRCLLSSKVLWMQW